MSAVYIVCFLLGAKRAALELKCGLRAATAILGLNLAAFGCFRLKTDDSGGGGTLLMQRELEVWIGFDPLKMNLF